MSQAVDALPDDPNQVNARILAEGMRNDERTGCAALSQGRRQGVQAVFHRTFADGKPQRTFRRRLPDKSRRPRRTRRRAAYDWAVRRLARRITLAADKGYDAEDLVNELRPMRVTPHVAQNVIGRS
jgi:hypothetical protein